MDFNSIKVRLERLLEFIAEPTKPIFQFHKGAIRTYLVSDDKLYVGNFNSIKVRLELLAEIGICAIAIHFNSIKVRLER